MAFLPVTFRIIKVELGGDNDEGRRSGCDSRLTDEDRLSDCGGGGEAAPAHAAAGRTGRMGSRPRWKRTGSAIKSRLSRSKSSILRRSQLLVRPLGESFRRAWKNSQGGNSIDLFSPKNGPNIGPQTGSKCHLKRHLF